MDSEAFWEAINTNELSVAWQVLSQNSTIDVNETQDGQTALHFAAEHQDVALTMLLYMKGADLNAKDSQGQTPLHKAAQAGNYQLVAFLVKAGANATSQDAGGKRPSFYAAGSGSPSTAELLTVAEADPQKAKVMASANVKDTESHRAKKAEEKLLKLGDKLAKIEEKTLQVRDDPSQRKSFEKLEREHLKVTEEIDVIKRRKEGGLAPSPETKRRSWTAIFGGK